VAAVPVLEKLVEEFPDDVLLGLNLGMAYGRLGRLDEAERVLTRVRKPGPHVSRVMSALGSVYFGRGKYREAEEMFETILSLDMISRETRFVSLINLGTLHMTVKDDPSRAVQYFERALRMHPESDDAHYHLALIFARDPSRREDAEEHAKAFLSCPQVGGERRRTIEALLSDLAGEE
jgi:tetratricopeptide (TPR) repeat protein